MKRLSLLIALISVAVSALPTQVEAARIWRRDPIARPTSRSIEQGAASYRLNMASHRRHFQKKLQYIEAVRDISRAEDYRTEAPTYEIDQQGYVPFNWYRTRRHVRHVYWQNHNQEAPVVKTGQGSAGQ